MINTICVYKVQFDNGSFYIGSTKNLFGRIQQYRAMFSGHSTFVSKIFLKAAQQSTTAMFSIIEHCRIDNKLDLETFYIQKYFGDNDFINRCPTAYSCKGLKMSHEDINRMKAPERTAHLMKYSIRNRVPVIQFDICGNKVCLHESVTAAAKSINVSYYNLNNHIKGYYKTYKGFVFRKIDENGAEIIPQRRYRPSRKIKGVNRTNIKGVDRYDIEGNNVHFISISDAAKSLANKNIKTNKETIRDILKGKRKSTQGFTFKYA